MGITDKDNLNYGILKGPTFDGNRINIFYLKPMVGNDLLGKSEYDVEIVKWIDGSTNHEINKMILRPIEAGNMIEFCRGKITQFTITSGALYSLGVVEFQLMCRFY